MSGVRLVYLIEQRLESPEHKAHLRRIKVMFQLFVAQSLLKQWLHQGSFIHAIASSHMYFINDSHRGLVTWTEVKAQRLHPQCGFFVGDS